MTIPFQCVFDAFAANARDRKKGSLEKGSFRKVHVLEILEN